MALTDVADAIQSVRQRRGRPRKRPRKLHADKGYDFERCRKDLRKRPIVWLLKLLPLIQGSALNDFEEMRLAEKQGVAILPRGILNPLLTNYVPPIPFIPIFRWV